MTEEEINKIISEFMDEKICESTGMILAGRVGTSVDPFARYLRDPYTKSLDALIPPVEKIVNDLDLIGWELRLDCLTGNYIAFLTGSEDTYHVNKLAPLALATACAKVIKEMK